MPASSKPRKKYRPKPGLTPTEVLGGGQPVPPEFCDEVRLVLEGALLGAGADDLALIRKVLGAGPYLVEHHAKAETRGIALAVFLTAQATLAWGDVAKDTDLVAHAIELLHDMLAALTQRQFISTLGAIGLHPDSPAAFFRDVWWECMDRAVTTL